MAGVAPVTATTSTAPPVSAATYSRIGFRVTGQPAPKGSARAIKRGDRAVLIASSSNANRDAQRAWAAQVGWAAKAAHRAAPWTGPIGLEVTFYVARPKSVRRALPEVKPDGDKLLRATADALTGILFVDDGQVTDWIARKRYATAEEPCGAWIEVWRVSETTTAGGEPVRSK